MNYQFKKRPVIIEAFQITKETRQNNKDWPEWLNEAWCKSSDEVGSVLPINFPDSDGTDMLCIMTNQGLVTVWWDDYIVRGELGELYTCKLDKFNKTYEAVS